MHKKLLVIVLGLLGVFILFQNNLAQAVQYTIIDLGTLGGTESAAYGLNESGQVVGKSKLLNSSKYHAFLYSNGAINDRSKRGFICI